MVGEAFVVSAQEGEVDRLCGAVGPFLIVDDGEQGAVEIVHIVVGFFEDAGESRVPGPDDLSSGPGELAMGAPLPVRG